VTVRETGETSTDYAHPYRPRPLAALNGLGRALSRWGLPQQPSLDVLSLMAAARRKEHLKDFGDPAFRRPLEILVHSIEREAELNLVGRFITRTRLVGMLANRLKLVELLRRDPSLASTPLRSPIVVSGLQRTGTTLLQRLLGSVPGARTVRAYENLDPMPAAPGRSSQDPRIRAAMTAQRALSYMAPDFFAIHPVEALEPEEEVVLMDHAFLSTTPEATMHVPTYASWLESEDQRPAYEMLRTMLNVIASGDAQPHPYWVLKTPHHLEWIETLFDVFPDAVVVQCHRDPQVTMGSFCSMVAHARGVFSDAVDPLEVGRHWSRKCTRMVNRAMDAREALESQGRGTFVDVSYYDLLKDPIAQVRRVHEAAGRPLTDEQTAAVERARSVHRKDKHGKHVYRLGDFGLTRDGFEAQMARYRERYAIPDEREMRTRGVRR